MQMNAKNTPAMRYFLITAGGRTYRRNTWQEARDYAQAMATAHPGETVYIFEPCASFCASAQMQTQYYTVAPWPRQDESPVATTLIVQDPLDIKDASR